MKTPSIMWTLVAPGFLLACYFCWANTTDDSFISFRYARNLASGLGLVFNPGERVECFSNPLWVLLLAGFEVLHLDLLTASKVTGVLCALVTLRTTMKIAIKHLGLGSWYGPLAALFLATEMGFVYYSVSGMETICFVMQITLLAGLLLEQRFLPASILSGTLLLTRPEGPLFILPLLATLIMRKRKFSAVLPFLMIPVTLLLIEVGWRYRYYGQVLPNTFQAKIGVHDELFRFLSTHTFNFAAYSALFSLRYLFLGLLLAPCLIA